MKGSNLKNPEKLISVYERSSTPVFPVFSVCTLYLSEREWTVLQGLSEKITRGKLGHIDLLPQKNLTCWLLFYTGNSFEDQADWNWRYSMKFLYLGHSYWQGWHHSQNRDNLPCLIFLHCTELASVAQSWWKPSGPYPECERINHVTRGMH